MGESPTKSSDMIIDRGRGPEIAGTRITVYSVLDFMIEGWHAERIAEFLRIHPEEAQAAMEYVREHTLEVLREYVKILERAERGNPPELLTKLDAGREKFRQFVKDIREAKARGQTDVRPLIEEFRKARAQEVAHARADGGQ
jgi:uncharacterized protein (DUF433 family)